MQRIGTRAKDSAGAYTDTGDDATAYVLTSSITVATNTVIFTAAYAAGGGRYVFEAKGAVNNSLAETVTLGIGPNSSVTPTTVELSYMVPSTAFAAGGGSVAWNATATNGAVPAVNSAFGASESKPFVLSGGLLLPDGAAAGTFQIRFNKTAGAGVLVCRTWSAFQFKKTNG